MDLQNSVLKKYSVFFIFILFDLFMSFGFTKRIDEITLIL